MSLNTDKLNGLSMSPSRGAADSAGWHDAPTCAGWWWSDVLEQWSKWATAGNAADIMSEAAAPWWGPWIPSNDEAHT